MDKSCISIAYIIRSTNLQINFALWIVDFVILSKYLFLANTGTWAKLSERKPQATTYNTNLKYYNINFTAIAT